MQKILDRADFVDFIKLVSFELPIQLLPLFELLFLQFSTRLQSCAEIIDYVMKYASFAMDIMCSSTVTCKTGKKGWPKEETFQRMYKAR